MNDPRYLDLELILGECLITGIFRDRALKQCLAYKENCRKLSKDGAGLKQHQEQFSEVFEL